MTARRITAGRITRKRAVAGGTLVIAVTALLLSTELPKGLSSAGGGSAALAELAARSPGMRIGGVALKAKAPRSLLPVDNAPAAAPGSAVASVLGTAVGPEGPVPNAGPVGPGGFPSDFTAPDVPGSLAPGAPTTAGGTPPDFANVPPPPIGGLPIFVPGGGGGTGTTPGEETPGGENPVVPPVPPVGPVPEPSVWLMLIAGFGMVGSAMRRTRRVRFA